MVMIDQKRMTYIPQPPSLKCFHTAAIEPSSVHVLIVGPTRDPRPAVIDAATTVGLHRCSRSGLPTMSCERAVDLDIAVRTRVRGPDATASGCAPVEARPV